MQLLVDENKLQLLLEQKKQYIGKRVTWDIIGSAVSFLISVGLASYHTIWGISGTVFKTGFVGLGIFFAAKSIYDVYQGAKDKYNYSDLFQDINYLNEITHNHSIVIVRDSFNLYPNRLLLYYDARWDCDLFLNYKENPNNETFIKNHLSAELKIPSQKISLTYVTRKIHEKYSESAKEKKWYCHKFYLAEIAEFPVTHQKDSFECDGKEYHWRTIPDLESDENVMKKNKDIVDYIKEIF